jgi:serine/alanine adding enzyme
MIRTFCLTTEEPERWNRALPPDANVFASLEYVRICEEQAGFSARLFVAEGPSGVVAYPFFLRPVQELPFASLLGLHSYDTYTPEYTGPMIVGEWSGELDFPESFADFCREQEIVAEFAHLNPWHVPETLLDPAGVEHNRDIVYVDLTWNEERIWAKSLTSDCRRQFKQSQAAGVKVRRATTTDDIRAFHRLYTETMDRRSALERYYFSEEYFQAFFEQMPQQAFYMLAEYQDRLVAGGIFFQDCTEIYWHLSAADMEYSQVRPVNAYLYETIRWALTQGKQRMLLGGGYEPNDGVFRFKANFSPLRVPFCTYKRIHNPDLCASLEQAWSRHYPGQQSLARYFPAYRSIPEPCPALA